jgi:hypothetical protein
MAEFEQFMRKLFLEDMTTQGILKINNLLAVTVAGGARTLTINTGAAVVAGRFYWNTAAVTKTLTHPTIGTTGWRLVLRAGWAAQTVRITLLQSADGAAAIPALTQTDGTTWDISLATGTITTGDVVTISTDDRVAADPTFGGSVPVGGIILWSGAIVDIPDNWALCDGTLGTPDLQNKFIVGAGDTYAVDATGGAATVNLQHAHTNVAEAAHTHTQGDTGGPSATMNEQSGTGGFFPTETHTHTNPATNAGSSHNHTMNNQLSATQSILPPYYALAYIMRIL